MFWSFLTTCEMSCFTDRYLQSDYTANFLYARHRYVSKVMSLDSTRNDTAEIQVPLWTIYVFIPAALRRVSARSQKQPLRSAQPCRTDPAKTGSRAAEQHSASGEFSK